MKMQEKDINITTIVERDKQQSTRMEDLAAKTRSQPQDIGRHEATAFTNRNMTLLAPAKQNQKERPCKRNKKDKILLATTNFFSSPTKSLIQNSPLQVTQ